MRGEHAAVFLEQKLSGMLAGFGAHLWLLDTVRDDGAPSITISWRASFPLNKDNKETRMQLQDKVIIVTGGGQGLGRAMAEHLAGRGARLALVDLNQERLDEAVAACKAAGGDARAYLCNVASEEQVSDMVTRVAEDFGGLHGLVNNAGILRDGLLLKVRTARSAR